MLRLKLFKAHNYELKCLDICENRRKIVSLSSFELKVWNLSNFKLLKQVKLSSLTSYIKIVKQNIYLCGIDPCIQVLDMKNLLSHSQSQNQGYMGTCLSISITHGLIAYGHNQVHLYDLRSQTEVCSRLLGSHVMCLAFVQSYILCGTREKKLFYLHCSDLAIKKCFYLKKGPILYVSSSKDLNILVYTAEGKSFFLDFKRKSIYFSFDMKISLGLFMEQQKQFILCNREQEIFVIKDYMRCEKILAPFYGYQILKSSGLNYCVLKKPNKYFILVNLETKEKENRLKLRRLKKGTLKYSKKTIIVSCLEYLKYLNH